MAERQDRVTPQSVSAPGGEEFRYNVTARHRAGRIWHMIFQASTIIGIIALTALLYNVINGAFGLRRTAETTGLENGIRIERLCLLVQEV